MWCKGLCGVCVWVCVLTMSLAKAVNAAWLTDAHVCVFECECELGVCVRLWV